MAISRRIARVGGLPEAPGPIASQLLLVERRLLVTLSWLKD
jgi:hypothetical protein